MKKKIVIIVTALMIAMTLTTSALAATFSTGNSGMSLTLVTGGTNKATVKTASGRAEATVKVQFDIINLAGGRETKYKTGHGRGNNTAVATVTSGGTTTGVKAKGKVGQCVLRTGYGVGFSV